MVKGDAGRNSDHESCFPEWYATVQFPTVKIRRITN